MNIEILRNYNKLVQCRTEEESYYIERLFSLLMDEIEILEDRIQVLEENFLKGK
jgi:hypothetical protein